MSGLIAFTGPPDPKLRQRMLATLAHRGEPVPNPIETAIGTIAVCRLSQAAPVGQTQTSCFDDDQKPFAFAGFLFNEVPREKSISNLSQLRGSFGFAFFSGDCLTIGRDPTGCQSLSFGRIANQWLVATEPKAFTSEKRFQCTLRPSAIALYLSCSFVPGSDTALENLYELPAGHIAELRPGCDPVISRYFNFEDDEFDPKSTDRISDADWIQRTRQNIEHAVAERMPSEPRAVFLSGGLDSSIIAAEVAKQSKHPIETFSIHFGKRYPNELNYARAVAEKIGSIHHEVEIKPRQFIQRFRSMIWHLDAPIGDPITQPNFELARIVGERFGHVFNGEGGDPLFGGPKNIGMLLSHWYGGTRKANYRERAYLQSYRRAWTELRHLLTDDLLQQMDGERDVEGVFTPFFTAEKPKSFLNKLMAINIKLKGADLILPKVDRMLAAHSTTPLSPLFDDRLTKLSFQMPPTMKLRQGIEKFVIKETYRDSLPIEIINRPKSGMRVPVHYWFQREMRRYAKSVLSRRRLKRAGIFNPDRVQQMLKYETQQANGRYGLRLWMLLTFEVWRRIVVDRESV